MELSHRPHIVVATPGRLAAHIQGGTKLDLSMSVLPIMPLRVASRGEASHVLFGAHSSAPGRVSCLVYDEADRLMSNASLQPDLGRTVPARFYRIPISRVPFHLKSRFLRG